MSLKGWGLPLLLGSSIFTLYSIDCYFIHQKFMVRNFNDDMAKGHEKESSSEKELPPSQNNVSFQLPNKQSSQRGMNVQFDHYYSLFEHSAITETHPNVEEYARAFFTSKAFTPERYVLKLATSFSSNEQNRQNLNIEEIKRLNFQIGDQVGVFRVVDRNENEILFETEVGTLTWLGFSNNGHSPNGKTLHFGSAVLKQNFLVKVLTPFHHLYSRYLLGFAKQQLMDELSTMKSRHN
ncbi:hypothetical protein FDP41_012144 [Naegleria fowleri]|uniref:DUF1990 domain-containing protein n=1 Tax=Naegleria fowleri TaxID=5763 RepID=A0A6A5BW64_NAEFO|nr:uncharacterized protein FDP41_012144 [Naegleria fowleri]KAF0981487.1 hypothetical protein FDP41_012144 [Naegleria fowleri]CAG4709958.1 unnamed protein product [Naegleria fowleri]